MYCANNAITSSVLSAIARQDQLVVTVRTRMTRTIGSAARPTTVVSPPHV